MDILIQQDGRIQTHQIIEPNRPYFRTVEPVMTLFAAHQHVCPTTPTPMIERTFRKLGTEGKITVWVEVR